MATCSSDALQQSTLSEEKGWNLYNRIQAPWNLIIIDIRSFDEWNKSHIVNSINIPNDLKLSKEQVIHLLKACQNKKNKISIGMIYYIISDRNNDYTKFIQLLEKLTHQNINKKIPFYHLKESFTDWYKKYSFLCIPDMLNDRNSVIKVNDKCDEKKKEEKEKIEDDIMKKLLKIINENIILYQKYPACIIKDSLYLGSVNHAAMKKAIINLNIGYIVNVTHDEKCYFENDKDCDVEYFRISIDDKESVNIKQYFENVFEFIENGIKCDKAVLVHCSAGISRSATIVIGYLMNTMNIKYKTARDYVRDKREVICPNQGFENQLRQFELELFTDLKQQQTGKQQSDKECIIL